MPLYPIVNKYTTYLTKSIGPDDVTLHVEFGTATVPMPFKAFLQNDSRMGAPHGNDDYEIIVVTAGGDGMTWKVTRGTENTTKRSWPKGNVVLLGLTAEMLNDAIAELAGRDGTDGLDGGTGPQGATGLVGPQGLDGMDGSTGPRGPTGSTGAAGPPGMDGLDGATGPQGSTGAAGADGQDGLDGSTGPVGATGATGSTGAAGADGVDGIDGSTGPVGATGATGATGSAGADGLDGMDGSTGPTGATGATGAAGAAGTDGTDGLDGSTGPQGATGPAGAAGATGPMGTDGLDGSTGPQGFTGVTGPQGPPGPDGLDGSTGPTGGTGATGAQGVPGMDGLDGSTGATGGTGPQGVQGVQGLDGLDGSTGATGGTGSTGATGPMGVDGLDGSTGATGAQGNTGSTGAQGPMGIDGLDGLQVIFLTPQIVLGSAAARGVLSFPIAADATIAAFDGTVPTTSAEGDAAAVGSVAFAARRDHRHGRESFATNAIALGSAAAAGVATTPFRSDDTIAAFDTTAPVNQAFGDAAAVGTAAFAARRDHKHGMPADYTTYLFLANGIENPVASTTYDFTESVLGITNTTNIRRIYLPYGGTIDAAAYYLRIGGTLSESRTSTMSLRKNDTTNTTLFGGTINCNAANATGLTTGLGISVAAGDYICIRWVTPAWTTAPTNLHFGVTLGIKLTQT